MVYVLFEGMLFLRVQEPRHIAVLSTNSELQTFNRCTAQLRAQGAKNLNSLLLPPVASQRLIFKCHKMHEIFNLIYESRIAEFQPLSGEPRGVRNFNDCLGKLNI